METFQRVKLDGYAMVISELEVELDLCCAGQAGDLCRCLCRNHAIPAGIGQSRRSITQSHVERPEGATNPH